MSKLIKRLTPYLLSLVLSSVVTSCWAAVANYTCTITKVGFSTKAFVALTDANGTFTSKAFIFPDAAKNQMLAIVLTAMNANTTVRVRADASLSNPVVLSIYADAP